MAITALKKVKKEKIGAVWCLPHRRVVNKGLKRFIQTTVNGQVNFLSWINFFHIITAHFKVKTEAIELQAVPYIHHSNNSGIMSNVWNVCIENTALYDTWEDKFWAISLPIFYYDFKV